MHADRELRHLGAVDTYRLAPIGVGDQRLFLLKVKEPVAPVRLLKRECFLQVERVDVDAVNGEGSARDGERLRLIERRAGELFVLVFVKAERA